MMWVAVLLVLTTPVVYMWLRFSLESDWSALLALAGSVAWVWFWLSVAA